ncbi:MAG: carboxypeptidase-like regulatory domain-containing protein, partial [Vicinamibacterales bacterium]
MQRKHVLLLLTILLVGVASLGVMRLQGGRAESAVPVALAGQVTADEGPLEGVLVRARRTGSTITITVVTDREGRYSFPSNRLAPGRYAIAVHAVGYQLSGSAFADVNPSRMTEVDLALRKADRLTMAQQMSNADWMLSAPGTWEEKTRHLKGCVSCHGLALVARTGHDAAGWPAVLHRMNTFAPVSIVERPQPLSAHAL